MPTREAPVTFKFAAFAGGIVVYLIIITKMIII